MTPGARESEDLLGRIEYGIPLKEVQNTRENEILEERE